MKDFDKQMQRRKFLGRLFIGGAASIATVHSLEATVKKEIISVLTGSSVPEKHGLQAGAYQFGIDKEFYARIKREFGKRTVLTKDDDGIVRMLIAYDDEDEKARVAQSLKRMDVQSFNTKYSPADIVDESRVTPQANKYYVQLGAFSEKENILSWKEALMKLGYQNLLFDRAIVDEKETYVMLLGPFKAEDEGIKSAERVFSPEAQKLGLKIDEMWTITYLNVNGRLEKDWLSLIKNEKHPFMVSKPELEKVKVTVKKKTRPIMELVAEKSQKYSVDSDFVSSIIQEESHFNPNKIAYRVKPKKVNGVTKFVYVKNKQGHRIETARGLMMISKDLAKDKRVIYGENLLDPELSLDLGVDHIKELMEVFRNETYRPIRTDVSGKRFVDKNGNGYKVSEKELLLFVAAAYNHGKGAVIPEVDRIKGPTGYINQLCGVREKIYTAVANLEQKKEIRAVEYADIEQNLPAETQRYVQRVKAQYDKLKSKPAPAP
ncbi:transglycosylase SLT domain-containing protein [Candidatus Woesearchaeota archaeon]|nr:transglycosylase SLT domain-containing protein [Candidatus Woesearchaeota archaeon]